MNTTANNAANNAANLSPVAASDNGMTIKRLAEVSTVPAGFRVCAAKWRNTANTVNPKESLCIVTSVITDEAMKENFELLAPHFRGFLEDVQDKILKQALEENYGKSLVAYSEIDLFSCIEYLETSNESGRLTKETVNAWFDATLADKLMLAFANRWGVGDVPTKEQEAKILRALKAYKEKIAMLAGTKTQFSEEEKEQVKKALSYAQDDMLARKFVARIDAMKDKAIDYLDAL